jgi:hypothetical protein
MKQTVFHKTVGFLTLMVLVMPLAVVSAEPADKGIAGDWLVKGDFEGWRPMGILSLSKDKQGKWAGQWISFWGVGELTDIKYAGNKLSFVQTGRFGDREFRSDFALTIEGEKLSGTLSSERGELQLEGKRFKPMPAAVGNWDMKIKAGEREFTATLVVKPDKEGKLTADWQSQWGEHEITDVQAEDNKLTFKRKTKVQDRQWESTFEGTVEGRTLSGTIKSERGETAAEGTLIGADLIGKWDLEITSERGPRRQILRVNPDLSAMYGPTAIDKVNLEGDKVTFQIVLGFGDRTFEINFEGKLDGNKLIGETTSPRGSQKVTGKKLMPPAKKV